MNVWAQVFLGVIAAATLAMSVAQVVVLIAAGRLMRRVGRLIEHIERETKPAFGHLNAITRDASRAVALATAQVERVDQLFDDVSRKVEGACESVRANVNPAREARAFMSALRAALAVVLDARRRAASRPRTEEDDPLFI